jgi:hypothetical protein
VGFKAVGAGILKVQSTKSQWTAQREKDDWKSNYREEEEKMLLRDERDGNTKKQKEFG